MSGTFSGFSEDDIRNVKGKTVSAPLNLELLSTKISNKNVKTLLDNKTKSIKSIMPNNEEVIVESPEEKKLEEINKPIDLEEFNNKQKIIEEQNRQRKELLSKNLALKTQKTREEVQRLNEIESDFKQLDQLLSNDVKLLREKIESASVEYMDAQKKFMKIEREYLEAKLNLQLKLEKKDLLTEHLCTIIRKNEERKAGKLNELIERLDLKPE